MYIFSVHIFVIAISNSSMYNDVRNSQEVETMFLLESKENIGKYLKKLIKERGFEKDADLSRA